RLRVLPGGRSEPAEPNPSPMLGEVGRSLRSARRRRHLTLDEAAEATRIPRAALSALDRGTTEGLPDPPYDRYFLREYANYVGLEAEPLLDSLAERATDPQPILPEFPIAERPPRRWPVWTLVLGSVAILAFLGLSRLGSGEPGAAVRAGSGVPAPIQAPRSQAGAAVPPRTPATHHGVTAVVHANDLCWIEATVDGRVVLRETLSAGRTVRLEAAHTLLLTLGNGGGTTVRVNGSPVETGAVGEVAHLSFAWRHGRLVGG
ncbi:MAG TPA: RodZ domain-containing protein, partial [Actinomycetota bacterium]|nr:RodZ domain-containing protein [Actinomycetota bacterium]